MRRINRIALTLYNEGRISIDEVLALVGIVVAAEETKTAAADQFRAELTERFGTIAVDGLASLAKDEEVNS